MSNRMTKEELRHDSFVQFAADGTVWLQHNFMKVLIGAALIAAAVVAIVFVQQGRINSQAEAGRLLSNATKAYSTGAYSEGLLQLDNLITNFNGTPEGTAALYFAGVSHLALGENDPCIERLKGYLDAASNGLYAQSARIGVALALEGRGDNAGAAQAFREVRTAAALNDASYTQAAYGEARALVALGQAGPAISVLESLLSSTDFRARQEAESRIAVLRAKNPGA